MTHRFQSKAAEMSPAEDAERTGLDPDEETSRRDDRSRLAPRWIGKQKCE